MQRDSPLPKEKGKLEGEKQRRDAKKASRKKGGGVNHCKQPKKEGGCCFGGK